MASCRSSAFSFNNFRVGRSAARKSARNVRVRPEHKQPSFHIRNASTRASSTCGGLGRRRKPVSVGSVHSCFCSVLYCGSYIGPGFCHARVTVRCRRALCAFHLCGWGITTSLNQARPFQRGRQDGRAKSWIACGAGDRVCFYR
jgi:hypothetical protein